MVLTDVPNHVFKSTSSLGSGAPSWEALYRGAARKAHCGLEGWEGFLVQPGLVLVLKEGGLSQLSTVKDGVQCCRKGPWYGQRQSDRKISFGGKRSGLGKTGAEVPYSAIRSLSHHTSLSLSFPVCTMGIELIFLRVVSGLSEIKK